MTLATARPRSLRLRLLALLGATTLGLALLPAGIALADPPVVEGSVSGTISGSDVGAGIPATLVWTETTTSATYSHPTTSEGWFYADLPYGTYTVTISSPGYQDANAGPYVLTVDDPDHSLDLALDPVAPVIEGSVSGTISGSDVGAGIPATLVWTETTTLATHSHPTTPEGWFYADLPYGTYTVTISSPGYQDATAGPYVLTVGDPDHSLDLALDPVAPVVEGSIGTISGVDVGTGIPATLVWTETTTLATHSHPTTAEGWYYADLPYGTYTVTISSPGYESVDRGPFTLTVDDPNFTLNVELDRDTSVGSVTGVVRDSISGIALSGVDVYITHGDGMVLTSVTSNGAGEYSITGFPPGEYAVGATNSTGPAGYGYGDPVTITLSGGVTTVQDLVLIPYESGSASVTGVIRDVQTGSPISGAGVFLSGDNVFFSGYDSTDGSGMYELADLAGGTYYYTVGVSGYVSQLGTITVPDDAPFVFDLNLVPLNATINGRVTDSNGDGIAGLWVTASEPDIGNSDQTDEDGYYSIDGLPGGTVSVSLGGTHTLWVAVTTDVTAVSNIVVTQDFQLELRTTSTIFGNVYPTPDAPGLDDICVYLLDAVTGEPLADTMSHAYEDATYVLENVAPGEYTVWFEDCDPTRVPQRASAYLGGGQDFAAATRFTVSGPADDQLLDDTYLAEVAAPTGSITVTVTDSESGDPVTDVTGEYYDGTDWIGFADDAENGTFTLSGLAFGSYQYWVEAPGYHREYSCSCVTIDEADPDVTDSIALDPYERGTGSLSGTVTAADTGDPLEAQLYLDGGGDPDYVYVLEADENGAYEFDDVPAGTFFFQVYIHGYGPEIGLVTIADGEDVVKDVVLLPADSAVEGIVTDSDDHPISAYYELWNDAGFAFMSDQTLPDGTFFIGELAAGDYTLHLGGVGSGYEEKVVPFTLNGGTTTLPTIVLEAESKAEIDGYVFDAESFDLGSTAPEGVEGLCVSLIDDSGTSIGDVVTTEYDGFFSLPEIDPGTYRVMFWECDPDRGFVYATGFLGGSTFNEADVFELEAGDFTFDIGLAEYGSSITGNISVSAPGGSVPLSVTRHVEPHLEVYVDDDWYLAPTPLFSVDAHGDYTIAGLPEGHYSVTFDDTETGARAYPSVSYFEEVDLDYDDTLSGIDVTFSPEKPTDPAVSVPTSGLGGGTKDTISGCTTLTPGATCDLELPDGTEGEYVSVFGHSTPVSFGDWKAVDVGGTVTVTVPSDFPAGAHKLVVQDANGNVIGWKDVTVPGVVTGTGGSSTGGKSGGSKSSTGAAATPTPTPTPSATVEPSAEPEPEASEEPATPSDPVDSDPEAQDVSVDAFPVGWVIGGGLGALLVIALILVLVARARRS